MSPFTLEKKRIIICLMMVVLSSVYGFSQTPHWQLDNNKAVLQKSIALPGKSASDIYHNLNRWLIAYFANPEDILKARLEDEYLRGEGYSRKVLTSNTTSAADFKYSFSFEIVNEKVIVKMFDGFLVYPNNQDENSMSPIESYFNNHSKARKNGHSNNLVLAAVSDFSVSFISHLENFLIPLDKE
jgi:hypothetical protein